MEKINISYLVTNVFTSSFWAHKDVVSSHSYEIIRGELLCCSIRVLIYTGYGSYVQCLNDNYAF